MSFSRQNSYQLSPKSPSVSAKFIRYTEPVYIEPECSMREALRRTEFSAQKLNVQSSGGTGGMGTIMHNEKEAMQDLNDRLASYLETVHSLEQANSKLELQIHEALEKRGPDVHDYSRYNAILDELKQQIKEMIAGNADLAIKIDNLMLAAGDFRIKLEAEAGFRQDRMGEIACWRGILDRTSLDKMKLEGDIEALREELIVLRKNHEEHVLELRAQIDQSGVQVDVDAPKGQDLAQIMAEMRAKYEKMALKNQEELKAWHESQISEIQVQVTQNTGALQGARTEVNDLRRQLQTLEIELESQKSLKASLEVSLRDTEMRYNMEMEKYNTIIMQLEAELTQLRANIQLQTQEYEALLNIKMKLEAEIATYRRLLDGGDLRLKDALIEEQTVATKAMTVTQTLVDRKVVSSITETEQGQH